MQADPDEDLLVLSQSGDLDAYARLIERHEGRVFGIVYQYIGEEEEARDITREVFYKAFRSIQRFRGNSKFSSWICRIAINRSIDHLRRKKHIRIDSLDEPVSTGSGEVEREFPDTAASPADEAERSELAGRIAEAVQRLSPKLRTVILLREYEGMSIEEIAEVVGVSPGTVKSRIFRARERLRRVLASYVEGRE